MLDKNIKDYDASIELLKDRRKQIKYCFLVFYIIGAVMSLGGFVIPYHFSIGVIGTGLAMLIIATWFFIGFLQYGFYIFLINKNMVKATKEKKPDKKVKK